MILKEYSSWMDVMRFAASRGDREWVYIITGRSGPTGKTHLCNMLKKNGYNAYEISEDIFDLVDYHDDKNHYKIDYDKKQVLIVLNKPLSLKVLSNSLYGSNAFHINYDLPPEPQYVNYPQYEVKALNILKEFYDSKNEIIPISEQKLKPQIKNVIFNYSATIVFWSDGTKTVVKAQEGDIFDPEKGLAMAISKKALGNKRDYYHTFLHWLKKYEKSDAKALRDFMYEIKLTDARTCSEQADEKKRCAVEMAYKLLVTYRDGIDPNNEQCNPNYEVDLDLDEVIGYLGEALED